MCKIKNKLKEAEEFAKSKNGEIYSSKLFVGRNKDKITFLCNEGHEFEKTYQNSVNRGQWCPYWPCQLSKPKYNDKIGFRIFKNRLKKLHDGRIECINSLPNLPEILDFKCNDCGDVFPKKRGEILFVKKGRKHPSGCENCGGSKKITFKEIKELTDKLNLILLSTSIKNAHEKLKLKCENGHEILNKTYNKLKELEKDKVRKTSICLDNECNAVYSKYTLDGVRKLAKRNGVIFIGDSFKDGNYNEHEWKCIEKNHSFLSTLNGVRGNKNPCPVCYEETLFNSIPKINKWLKENEPDISIVKGEKYKGGDSSIKLFCSICENITSKRPLQIKKRSLCNVCKGNASEKIVSQYMKQLFGGEWRDNIYPFDWLVNENGNKMELDGYCEKLNLAFEHHGIQHYSVDGEMTQDDDMLRKSKARDKKKEKLCFEHGIKLIVINQLNTITMEKNLKEEIKAQCDGMKTKLYGGFYPKNCCKIFPVPYDFESIVPFPKSIYTAHLKEQFPKAQEIAKDLDFEILSKVGANLIKLKCNLCGEEPTRTMRDFIEKKNGCSCYGNGINFRNKKDVIELYKKLAKKYQAKFLGIEIDSLGKKRVKFKCLICEKNPNLIQPIHSIFDMADYSFRSRFEKPIIDMKLLAEKQFHPDCGAFNLSKLTLGDIQKYIKKFEPTAEILIAEAEFVSKKGRKYKFKCSNKKHPPIVVTKDLVRISDMRKNNSFGCKSCGQLNSNRPKESYKKQKCKQEVLK
jgi:hypothetical protein